MSERFSSAISLEDALEICLPGLQAGEAISDLVLGFPALADELAPLLEAAQAAILLAPVVSPTRAMQRSRTQMLGAAAQLRKAAAPRPIFSFARAATIFLILAGIFLVSLLSVNVVSAAALPGDRLYTIKRSFETIWLSVAPSNQLRDNLAEAYQQRRLDEVQQLLIVKREYPVAFTGVVEEVEILRGKQGERWLVSGVPVLVTSETEVYNDPALGWLVDVKGLTQSVDLNGAEGEIVVIASEIRPREYAFCGNVEHISPPAWTISGVKIAVTPLTQIDGGLQVGDAVIVLVAFDELGDPFARALLRPIGTPSGKTPTPPTTVSPSETMTPSPAVSETDDDLTETHEPDETDEPEETEEPEGTEEPAETEETDEPTATPRPSRTVEPTESEEPPETEEPDETNEPTETEAPG